MVERIMKVATEKYVELSPDRQRIITDEVNRMLRNGRSKGLRKHEARRRSVRKRNRQRIGAHARRPRP
jgi:hypothetical protein